MDDHNSKKKDHKRDDDHLPTLHSPHVDHICHHLLQASLLRSRSDCELDKYVGNDDYLHQRDGETAHNLLLEDDRPLADILSACTLH